MSYDYLYGNERIINIGSNVSINTNVILSSAGRRISIGNDDLTGPNVIIRTSNHKIKKKSWYGIKDIIVEILSLKMMFGLLQMLVFF